MLKITKFGGSSVANAEQFKKVKTIIESDPARRFVVVSAAGRKDAKDSKVTDLLYLCHAHIEYHVDYLPMFRLIEQRFLDIKEALSLNTPIEPELKQLEGRLPELSLDELVSRGEYFTARLMADYLGFPFVDAKDIISMHYDGSFNYEDTSEKLKEVLKDKKTFVIPGFYGSTPDGRIRVMTRGGSDITGSILARCLHADEYENWTDVSGFLMADPRIVKNPKNIERITYSELRELSYMGASVLHEDSIFPIREYNIPIHILNTNRPQDQGTLILDNISDAATGPLVTGIAGKKNFCAVEIYKNHMSNKIGIIRKALTVFEKYNVSVEHIPSGIDSFSVVVHADEVKSNIYEIIAAIKAAIEPDSIRLVEDLALIAIVGRNMNARPGCSGKIFDALGQNHLNVRMIAQGSDEMTIVIGVEDKDFDKTISVIYDRFSRDN
ncbi:MAG: aspartate kinase [Eubacteriales bacterium]|nr:aspartate kinase [Eubacteriales bacterium]